MNAYVEKGVNKESASFLAMAAMLVAAIMAKLRPTFEAGAPEGFEDAEGFHFGSASIEDQARNLV
jgi:hypothetical protein